MQGGLLLAFLILLWAPAKAMQVEPVTFHTNKGAFVFQAEIARSHAARMRGLMFRRHMPPDRGMLFDWGQVRVVHMWMKNTFIPLDMIFVRADGTVSSIEANTQPHSLKLISSREPVAVVIELNAGMAAQIGLQAGDRVEHPLFLQRP